MGHYEVDADTYANDWQVDYLKVDFCGPTSGKVHCVALRCAAGYVQIVGGPLQRKRYTKLS